MDPVRFTALIARLCELIARHGHLRRIAGPLVVLIWRRVRGAARQVEGLLARLRAGQLRRYPARRTPRPAVTPRRPPSPPAFPTEPAWLIRLIPETAVSAVHLRAMLADPDIPALLEAAPQLRRALRPLCRMLDVSLPRRPTPAQPEPPPEATSVAPAQAGVQGHPTSCPRDKPALASGGTDPDGTFVFTPA
jgi:hypothetical protein